MFKNIKLSKETKEFLKTILVVFIAFGICYVIFLLMGKAGMFEEGYTRPETTDAEFTYNTAIIGTVFNRPETEYYVAFNEEDENVYFDTLVGLYSGDLQIYNVNMSLGVNAKYIGEKGNSGATTAENLTIVCPTLIKIKNGKIVKYLEDIDAIKVELGL